jgi:NAD(P)-dependent dehydrogenase (short-subunit alcohol dehydrogenase family)
VSSVLVTGASTGIGAATAKRLAANESVAWAGVRDSAAVAELDRLGNPKLRPIELDVTDAGSIDRGVERIAAEGGLDAVVNNAGIGVPGPLELLTADELREQLDVNVVGQLAVTRAALPLLRQAEQPKVLFVNSVGGRVDLPFAGAYNASKLALEACAEALRTELRDEGIAVCV